MSPFRFFETFTRLTLGRLCRQRWLLAGLVLLCFLLPLGTGRMAGRLLSRGVAFSGVTLAVTAPEGDDVPQLLERFMGDMEDIGQYCQIRAMEEGAALEALEDGEVTAVLCLPENFIRGVMWGENPDLRLIVDGNRPLESLLLLWVGQSASDILAAFQSGVYAVLDLYEASPPPGLTRDQVMVDINLRYITLAVGRADMFQTREVPVTGSLPISLHYSLALLAYFALSAAPLFVPVYGGDWLAFQRRLRGVGRAPWTGFLSGTAAGTAVLLLLLAPALLLLGGGNPLALAGTAVLMALYCALYCALCCLAARSAASCGLVSCGAALVFLGLAGGIVPPVLLPGTMRQLSGLSPVRWLMELAAWPMGYEMSFLSRAGLALTGAGMAALALALYRRRVDRQEVEP